MLNTIHILLEHYLSQKTVHLAVAYTLPTALQHHPKFDIILPSLKSHLNNPLILPVARAVITTVSTSDGVTVTVTVGPRASGILAFV